MVVTQEQIDALVDAIARGERRVRFPEGGEVEYRDVDQMLKALQSLQAMRHPGNGTPWRLRRTVVVRD